MYLNPGYYTLTHRFWESTTFNIQIPTQWPLILLCLATGAWIVKRDLRAIIPPLLGLQVLVAFDAETSLAIISILSVITALYLGRRLSEYMIGLLVIIFAVEAESLLHWLVFAPLGVQDPLQMLTRIEQGIYYLTAQINPIYMLTFTLACIAIPLYHITRKPGETKKQIKKTILSNRVYLALGLTLLLSVIVAVYPYTPNINPNLVDPGVDIRSYLEEYQRISVDPTLILTASGGSRPVYYLLFFLFEKAASLDPLTAIRFLPIILNPLLTVSAFILTREAIQDSFTAAYAALFTAAGYTLSVGMYAYFLADMLMLSIIFLSLSALIKSLREHSTLYLVAATSLGSLFVFTHPWTFDQYLAAVGGATLLIILSPKRSESPHEAKWLIIYCVSLASSDILKILLMRGSVEGVAALGFLSTSITTPATFWLDLLNSSKFYVGGYLTNIPLLTLAAAGLMRTREKTTPNLILQVLVGATSATYLIGDTVVKSRLLYNLPIGVLAAYGIRYIEEQNINQHLKTALKATLIVTLISYLFRDLANLV